MSQKDAATAVRLVCSALTLVGLAVAGCGPTAYKITPVPVDQTLDETVVLSEGGLAPPKIALIDVSGLLLNAPEPKLLCEGEHSVSLFTENLRKAVHDDSVRAIVIRINSPGGSVTAADLMYQEILRVRNHPKHAKPVVAIIMDLGASGGYYAACACDKIIACRTSVVGSIGVIMQLLNVRGTFDKIGMDAVTIKSGEMKDAGSPFRHMTDAERAVFQGLIDEFYDRFVSIVATGRPNLTEAKVREFSDGRVWTASQALELGLIDGIGTLHEAIGLAKEMAGLSRVRVVTYHRPLAWKPTVYAEAPAGPASSQFNVLNVNMAGRLLNPQPMFMYLWSPGL
ncbi:MAG: signal peptide peptidase SppA [Phycisphaerae bacterium]|nr:signal peptide peptidase SppA [Phycisphaerae bacterium]